MLEKEGVVFDYDGKICIDCFVDVSSVTVSVAAVVSLTTAQGNNKKRKAGDGTTKKTKSKYSTDTTATQSTTTISKDALKQEILTLLQKRQAGKTC